MEVENIWVAVPDLIGVEVNASGQIRGTTNQPYCNNDGYLTVRHQGQPYLVHRLICRAFHGPAPSNKRLTLHWNDVKTDNRADNLRWGDALENARDAVRNGITVGPKAWKPKTLHG